MLKIKNSAVLRTLLCLLTATAVLFAFSGCGDSSDDNSGDDTVIIDNTTDEDSDEDSDSESESEEKVASPDDLALNLGNGDTFLSRDDYTLLGNYYYVESYRVETEEGGVMTELGIDMYLNYDEDSGYSNADGVLAIYYDEDGNITGYEAYVGLNPVRQTVNYQVGTDCSYFTAITMDSDGVMTGVLWDNTVTNAETGITTYYSGIETYYENGVIERSYEEQYIVGDDGILTISQTTTKEYDEDGNIVTDETVEY